MQKAEADICGTKITLNFNIISVILHKAALNCFVRNLYYVSHYIMSVHPSIDVSSVPFTVVAWSAKDVFQNVGK